MSKNMTRKGLSLGAASLLAVSSLVSAPAAYAADMDVTPLYGSPTNFNGVQALSTGIDAGMVLQVNTGLTGATATNGGSAFEFTKWLIEIVNPDVTWADINNDGNLGNGTVPSDSTANNDSAFAVGTGTAFATGRTPVAVGGAALTGTETSFVVNGDDAVANNLRISATYFDGATTAGDTLSFKVTAFLDLDGDDRNDDGRSGTPVTVALLPNDAVTLTPTFDYNALGASKITGQISSNVNLQTFEKLEGGLSADATGAAELSVSINSDIANAAAQSTLLSMVFDAAPAADSFEFGVPADNDVSDEVINVTIPTTTAAELAVGMKAILVAVGGSDITDTTGAGAKTILGIEGEIKTIGAAAGGVVPVALQLPAASAFTGALQLGNAANTKLEINTLQYNSTLRQYDFTFNAPQVSGASGANATVSAGKYTATAQLNSAAATLLAGNGALLKTKANAFVATTFVNNSVDHLDITLSQGAQNDTAGATSLLAANSAEVPEGTKKLDFTVTVWDDAAETTAVGSGVAVQVTLGDVLNDLGTTTITSEGKTLKATGDNSVTFTKNTNANGQISFSVVADKAVAGESFTVAATAEGVSKTAQTVKWEEIDYTVLQIPSDINYTIAPKGTVSVQYMVVDQYGKAPSGNFQLAVTRGTPTGDRADDVADQANWSYAVPLSTTGRATVTIVDNGSATVEGGDTVTVALQEAATAGGGYVATDAGDTDTFTLTYETDWAGLTATAKVNNNGVAIGTTAVYPVAVEPDTLVDFDGRVSTTVPKYDADNTFDNKTDTTADQLLKISGTVADADNDGVSGVAVVISGAGMNFASADTLTYASTLRMLNDSILVTTDANGDYEAFVRSSVGGLQTISVDAQGAKATASVTFAASTGAAAAMDLSVASSVVDGKTADVKVTVTDKLGNPVSGVTVTFKESGPGYLNTNSGTTDSDGEVIVNLITVSGDTGTSTITASATIAGVASSVTKTMTVGAAAASADQKVNAGSFKGYVALYAKGYAGKRMSAKVGKDWVVVESLASNFERVVEFTGAGYTISVPIYIDRVLVDTIVVTTK